MTNVMKKFYITTAIDYANGSPHLGHAYEKVLADVIARYRRLQGDDVHFITGLDEHGMKVQQSANRNGVAPQRYVDRIALEFRDLLNRLLISNDDYIRTTEGRHKEVVREILQLLYDKGEIYKGEYRGFYSVRAEQFVLEKEKVEGVWPALYGEVLELTEENYFFRLSKYQDWLIDHIKAHEDFIFPYFRAKQVLQFLKEPINDLCISRPRERLEWGIPLPFDEAYVNYVWFDALINYVSAVRTDTTAFNRYWPADYHVIGKDILVPPHAVYWSIILKACGFETPRCFLVHGFWTTSGKKMSKTEGDTVDPLDLIDQFGPDAFRYFVTREMNVGQDSDFTLELFLMRYTSDLANDLGNLLSRLLNMGHRYCDGVIPEVTTVGAPEAEVHDAWERTREAVLSDFESFGFNTAMEKTFTFVRGINRYAEIRAPWRLSKSKDPDDRRWLETTLGTMVEAVRLIGVLLAPVMPTSSERILRLLGSEPVHRWGETLRWSTSLAGRPLGEKTILFPKPR